MLYIYLQASEYVHKICICIAFYENSCTEELFTINNFPCMVINHFQEAVENDFLESVATYVITIHSYIQSVYTHHTNCHIHNATFLHVSLFSFISVSIVSNHLGQVSRSPFQSRTNLEVLECQVSDSSSPPVECVKYLHILCLAING